MQDIFKAEQIVKVLQEVDVFDDQLLNLVLSAEQMGVVLVEFPHPRQPRKGPRYLVSVQNPKIKDSYWQILIAPQLLFENQAMGGAVHGLNAVLHVFVILYEENVLLVLVVVPTHFPDLVLEYVGGVDLCIISDQQLLSHDLLEVVEYLDPLVKEEYAARAQLVDEEQLLPGPDVPVVLLF